MLKITKNPQVDHAFEDVFARAHQHAQEGRLIFQKFTCRGCGGRLTMEAPNQFWEEGTCDQPQCKTVLTDIRAQGCNYLMVTHPQRASLGIPYRMQLNQRDPKPAKAN